MEFHHCVELDSALTLTTGCATSGDMTSLEEELAQTRAVAETLRSTLELVVKTAEAIWGGVDT